ncbi:MAG: Asp/Glu racemase [Alphaproteobacteria bacterium]|jgi:maleate isomerase|nr:Asp/Glu racemase [Alphaproteobacteria bacterium]MBT4018628.1 Asp/Glu racemase [Alphaproteobacteria bacterium]MBT5158400.1 Asp/Glu racemase [Alphaproteobacteria bacterium]
MSEEVTLTKPQDPWIGARGRIGVVIPSTNIGVEYDCQRFIPEGISWHFARFFIEHKDLTSDNAFLAFIEAIRLTIPGAMRDIMTAEPTNIMMGMSAETFWGGLSGNDEFSARLREHMPDEMSLTTGADAIRSALKQFNVKNISVVSPYQPIGDEQVLKFFTESGFNVKHNIGLRCDTANSIAHTPQKDVLNLVVNEMDGDDVDAIVQVGTNMSNSDLFPTIEKMLGKPVIPINVACIWHALRAIGVKDQFVGKGWLMERH